MPDSHEFITSVNQLLAKLNESGELNTGLEIANRIMILLGSTETEPVENIVDEHVMQLPNAERYDHWFQNHPWMGGERAAFEVLDAKETPVQAKFYWLKKRSRQFIAGGVHFTENWEDAPYTRNDNFKIGIDFFLAPDGKSLLITLSNKGNLRIVELQNKLNNTQVEIFTKWREAVQVSSIEALHNTLWDSFMLQSVNKEFYKGVANSFTELLQHLRESGREEEASKLFASRLLGRLLFVWFLRKKSIIDESMGYFDATGANSTNYYRNSLERLFFNTLNVPIDDRDEFKNENQKRLLEVEDNEPQTKIFQTDSKTPYLNGGLFEPHENDWYRDTELTFPEGYFTNLFEHFNQFNFTTDESTPEYEQVAIDPEMLGQVFESLLATQVDETGQQARKAKGAFYTPREIVSYMCKESLRNYLYGKVEDDERYTQSVDLLLDRSDHEWAGAGSNSKRDAVPKEYRSIIVDALDTVTVLDPACGSGAFPMGMLQLLIKTYERLEGRFDPYKTKLQIVQNNIFGVDIEPMAIEIARLRAWLSLIVDEEESQKVAPLPNLDFKFVCANSLIPLDKEQGLFSDSELHQKLKDIRIKYFNARVPSSKKKLQSEYNKLADSSQQTLMDDLRTLQLKSFDPFKNSQPAKFFDPDQMFGLETGFDLVIGNPPYVRQENINFKDDIKKYHIYSPRADLYTYFIEMGFKNLKSNGILTYITSHKYMRALYGKNLREYLKDTKRIINIVDFKDEHVFEAITNTSIIIAANTAPPSSHNIEFTSSLIEESKPISQSSLHSDYWILVNNDGLLIKHKIDEIGTKLGELDYQIYYGVKTGYNDAFVIDKKTKNNIIQADARSSDLIKPLIRGRDIGKYSFRHENLYIIITKFGSYKSLKTKFPGVYEHLLIYQEKLKARGQCKTTRTGKSSSEDYSGQHHWLELDNNPNDNYLEAFTKRKIIWIELSSTNKFAISEEGEYILAGAFMMIGERLNYLLGVLNSKLALYYFKMVSNSSGMATMQWKKFSIERIPIVKPSSNNQIQIEDIEKLTAEVIRERKTNIDADTKKIEDEINRLIYTLYGLSDSEVQTIENSIF